MGSDLNVKDSELFFLFTLLECHKICKAEKSDMRPWNSKKIHFRKFIILPYDPAYYFTV